MRAIYLSALITMATMPSMSAEVVYSYDNQGSEMTEYFGYGKSEVYDVAIRIPGEALAGVKLTGLKVAVPKQAALSECKGWLSTGLELKRQNGKYVNAPDICVKEAIVKDGELSLTFDEPYTLTEQGIYAGYSFKLDNAEQNAVALAPGDAESGLWIHASRSKMKWTNIASEINKVSAMCVAMEGDIAGHSVMLQIKGTPIVAVDESVGIPVELTNYGSAPVNKIAYTYTTPAGTGTGVVSLPEAIRGVPGNSKLIELNIGSLSDYGLTEVSLAATEVDGMANACRLPECKGMVKAVPFIPVNRPLFEEYTGLWCGWCPRGFVALEVMKERYPETFIGIAYHSGDAMTCLDEYPNDSGGSLPMSFINRSVKTDPGDIYDLWPAHRTNVPEAGIDVQIQWADDAKTQLCATSSVRFMEDHENADYRISYILVGDGLENDKWAQSNSYSGADPARYPTMNDNKWGRIFLSGKSKIPGLTFNDVALSASGYEGVANSIPESVKAGEVYSHTHVFNVSDVYNASGESIINAPDKLRVVAVVTEHAKNRVVNCNTSLHADGSPLVGLTELKAEDKELRESIYFDLTGRSISEPEKGMYIRVDVYTDGSRKALKQYK